MKLFRPFSRLAQPQATESAYLRHARERRFLYALGTGIQRVADGHAERLIEAQREEHQQLRKTLRTGFEGVQHNQIRIHQALLNQTEVMILGFDAVELRLQEGFEQQARGLNEVVNRVDHLGQVVVETGERLFKGLAGLKASFDHGMMGIVAQFELQREEMQDGFARLADLLAHQQKTRARERFLDGKLEFERYQAHPDEPQLLIDARDYLHDSLQQYRGNPFAHFLLGLIYLEPVAHFDPGRALDHFLRGVTYAKSLENYPLAALCAFEAGWVHYLRGEIEQAIEQSELARSFDPDALPENYFHLAKYHACQGEAQPALQHLDTAVQRFDPLYTLKADIDPDFGPIRPQLDPYFEQLRDRAARDWQARMARWRLG
jgi:tetratricopeptide (TPR) repeat protein